MALTRAYPIDQLCLPALPRGRPLTAGLQLCGEDVGVLHLDLVDASILGTQVMDQEVVAVPQLLPAVLGLAAGVVGDLLTVLWPERKRGFGPRPHSGGRQPLPPTGWAPDDTILDPEGEVEGRSRPGGE